MSTTQVIVAIVIGLAVAEFGAVTPSAARKVAAWSARRRYADHPERAKIRAEEWADVVDGWNSNVCKVLLALRFAGFAVAVATGRTLRKRGAVLRRKHPDERLTLAGWALAAVWLLGSAIGLLSAFFEDEGLTRAANVVVVLAGALLLVLAVIKRELDTRRKRAAGSQNSHTAMPPRRLPAITVSRRPSATLPPRPSTDPPRPQARSAANTTTT